MRLWLAQRAGLRRPVRVLVLIDLMQDIDVLLPVLVALRADRSIRLRIVVSRWLRSRSPRVAALLAQHGLGFIWVRRDDIVRGDAPSLGGLDAVLTASESAQPAHSAGHALTLRANLAGLRTYTLQHGLENPGLFGPEADCEFASQAMFTWHPPTLTLRLPQATRARLRHVGRPAPLALALDTAHDGEGPTEEGSAPPGPRFDVAVFENLHAERYDDDQRRAFLQSLAGLAASGAAVLLKPHPAGGWSLGEGRRPPGVSLAAALSANQVIARARRVITTPSTIALDAAMAGQPVALCLDGGALYEPLPRLESPQDWLRFCADPVSTADELEVNGAFVQRVVWPGNATPQIVEAIAKSARKT